jgi:hypothetical protein
VTVGSSQNSSNNTSMNSDGYQNITQDSIWFINKINYKF